MGAKIAQPDYADPQKLFAHLSNSQINLNKSISTDNFTEEKYIKSQDKCHKMFDLQSVKSYCIDTGQKYLKLKSPLTEKKLFSDKNSSLNSPKESHLSKDQTSDSYYEKILDKTLNNDEPRKSFEAIQNTKNCAIINEKLVNNDDKQLTSAINTKQFVNNSDVKRLCSEQQPIKLKPALPNSKPIRRPIKPPPPIPAKPARFLQSETISPQNTKGWVKTVVGRFE